MSKKIKYFVKESSFRMRFKPYKSEEEYEELSKTLGGWGNGYIVIPSEHPLYGHDFTDIGNITFQKYANEIDWPEITPEDKNCYVIGFDTGYGSLEIHNREYVEHEAKRLAQMLEAMWQ